MKRSISERGQAVFLTLGTGGLLDGLERPESSGLLRFRAGWRLGPNRAGGYPFRERVDLGVRQFAAGGIFTLLLVSDGPNQAARFGVAGNHYARGVHSVAGSQLNAAHLDLVAVAGTAAGDEDRPYFRLEELDLGGRLSPRAYR